MKNLNQTQLKVFTFLGFAFLSIPLSIWILWIYIFDLGTTQSERVSIFKGFFPSFLQGRWDRSEERRVG